MSNTKVMFLHIIKCGGMTMRAMLAKYHNHSDIMPVGVSRITEFHESYPHVVVKSSIDYGKSITPDMAKSYNVIFGHYDWHLADNLPSWDVIIMMRNPVSQIKSLYRYMKGDQYAKRGYQWIRSTSFIDWINDPRIEHLLNAQTTYLSGHYRRNIRQALKNLDHPRVCIGLVEKYDESIERINKRYGWSLEMTRVNVNNTPDDFEISKEGHRLIKVKLANDIALYEKALRIFENQTPR